MTGDALKKVGYRNAAESAHLPEQERFLAQPQRKFKYDPQPANADHPLDKAPSSGAYDEVQVDRVLECPPRKHSKSTRRLLVWVVILIGLATGIATGHTLLATILLAVVLAGGGLVMMGYSVIDNTPYY